jgi:predicted DNA binding CopG/RHH family protein
MTTAIAKKKDARICVSMEPSLLNACRDKAKQHGMSVSNYIRNATIAFRATDLDGVEVSNG